MIATQSGQFIIGMMDGNIESYESLDLAQLLSADELDKLWKLAKTRGVGIHHYRNYDERVFARSKIVNSDVDEMGRKGTVNHTVLFKFDEFVHCDGLIYRLEPQSLAFLYHEFEHAPNFPFPKLTNPLPKPKWG